MYIKRQLYSILLFSAILLMMSCEKSFDPSAYDGVQEKLDNDAIRSDSVIWAEDGVELWLSGVEHSGIVLGEIVDPTLMLADGWRVPTLNEGRYLHTLTIQGMHSSERYLCYDAESGVWYSFLFGNQGSITKAGTKTKYTLCGVKSVENGKVIDGVEFKFVFSDEWNDDLDIDL